MEAASPPQRPDSAAAHRALQETLRSPDTFAAAAHAADASPSVLKRLFAPLAARLVRSFASRQVEWNLAVTRALETIVRAFDERDARCAWIEERLRSAEQRIERMETELRAAREAEHDARRKLASLGIQLRELEAQRADRRPPP
jgi:septal ring factor EnvC (AmiA/AmiB activator)